MFRNREMFGKVLRFSTRFYVRLGFLVRNQIKDTWEISCYVKMVAK